MNHYFILTGAPGTGKTTVLKHLRNLGYQGADEVAREVLSHQLSVDGPALPAKSPKLFIQKMLGSAISKYESGKVSGGPVFFDRGIPDLIAYAVRFDVNPEEFIKAAEKYKYNSSVFIFNPWKEIFVNDNERRLTFEMTVQFHESIVQSYKSLGYKMIVVPNKPVESIAEFILNNIRF